MFVGAEGEKAKVAKRDVNMPFETIQYKYINERSSNNLLVLDTVDSIREPGFVVPNTPSDNLTEHCCESDKKKRSAMTFTSIPMRFLNRNCSGDSSLKDHYHILGFRRSAFDKASENRKQDMLRDIQLNKKADEAVDENDDVEDDQEELDIMDSDYE